MLRRPLQVMLPSLLAVTSMAYYAGGWASITVDDLPDYVVAGEPVTLSYTVRQHGLTLLDSLRGSVEARMQGRDARARSSWQGKGRYVTTLTMAQPGEWTVTIRSGFGKSDLTLLPLRVVAKGTRPVVALANDERGRRLFVAKGCVGCHVHRATNIRSVVEAGPELTERSFPADYLAGFLANPAASVARLPNAARMPKLELSQGEIASLVAFINADHRVAKRE